MAPVSSKADASVDGLPGSSSNDSVTGRRGKKRSADTPNPVDDKLDAKRLKGGDNSSLQHEGKDGNGTEAITASEEELISKRREAQDFVKLVTKAVNAAKDDR
jgi:hypothetical protein